MDTLFHSGLGKECPLVRANCTLHPITLADIGNQFDNYTRHRSHARGWASLFGILLF
jgi:hypothetical protein